jgi:hypothetical protein
MDFKSEENNRLTEDANCPNKEILYRAELIKFFLKILYGLDYSVMIVFHVVNSRECYKVDI